METRTLKIYQYESKYGKYEIPEKLRELLKGKIIEEQLKHFKTTAYLRIANKTSFDMDINEYSDQHLNNVEDDEYVEGIIVDNEIVIGLMVNGWYKELRPCFLNNSVCTYSASDNNGAGYKEVEYYLYLVSVPVK